MYFCRVLNAGDSTLKSKPKRPLTAGESSLWFINSHIDDRPGERLESLPVEIFAIVENDDERKKLLTNAAITGIGETDVVYVTDSEEFFRVEAGAFVAYIPVEPAGGVAIDYLTEAEGDVRYPLRGEVSGGTGGGWTPYPTLIAPESADFTQLNFGAITALSPVVNGLNLRIETSPRATASVLLGPVLPAYPWTVVAAFKPQFLDVAGFPVFGLGIYNQRLLEGLYLGFRPSGVSTTPVLQIFKTATTQAFVAFTTTTLGNRGLPFFMTGELLFMRITDDGVTRVHSLSNDGQQWYPIVSQPTTANNGLATDSWKPALALFPDTSVAAGFNLYHMTINGVGF